VKRWAVGIAVLCAVTLAALYALWPLWSLQQLAVGVQRRDPATLARLIEFPELRRSLAHQISRTYLTITGLDQRLGPLEFAIGSVADPLLARFLTPDGIATLLDQGWPAGLPEEGPPLISKGIGAAELGSFWRLFAAADYSGREFSIGLPLSVEPSQQFRLHLRLIAGRWKLVSVDLPNEINLRFAQLLVRATKK
jgi:hypothetical protein